MSKHKPRPSKVPARQELRQRLDVRCLCPQGKVWAPSKSQAKKLYKQIARRAHNTDQVWFYDCPQGGVHWTRMPPYKWPKNQQETP